MKDRRWLFWLMLIGMLVLDQSTKAWARHAFVERHREGFPIPGVLELTLTYNKGIAFGMLQGSGVLMTPIALGIAIAALIYSHRNRGETRWTHVAMGLLASGALGNLYDRLFLGKVTDMIYVTAINFPVFNVADACITTAAIMLMLVWAKDVFKPTPESPKLPAASETVENPVP